LVGEIVTRSCETQPRGSALDTDPAGESAKRVRKKPHRGMEAQCGSFFSCCLLAFGLLVYRRDPDGMDPAEHRL